MYIKAKGKRKKKSGSVSRLAPPVPVVPKNKFLNSSWQQVRLVALGSFQVWDYGTVIRTFLHKRGGYLDK